MARQRALGYLRSDVSRYKQRWDEYHIRHHARLMGLELGKIVAFSDRTSHPIEKLLRAVKDSGATALVVPGVEHFDEGRMPPEICQITDIFAVDSQRTYPRRDADEEETDRNETQQ
ncbi:hypothetical protein [Nocardia jiangxiensis]|uniref:Resolvase, N terminal domain n=1 Tax=Nocardia jiangxiensis TaxID=282685 RepID=A0ABW6S3T7_9NOCA|nr:hypothetical protein [Nocardia jiangxiensis]